MATVVIAQKASTLAYGNNSNTGTLYHTRRSNISKPAFLDSSLTCSNNKRATIAQNITENALTQFILFCVRVFMNSAHRPRPCLEQPRRRQGRVQERPHPRRA